VVIPQEGNLILTDDVINREKSGVRDDTSFIVVTFGYHNKGF
jgi:hypothetical protein